MPTILVIDDDPDMQRWASAVLHQAGMRTVPADDATTALMLVRRSKPDAIVLDLGLPGGGGKSFLERLRRLAPFARLPVLVMSGRITPDTPAELAPLGVTVFLEKPVAPGRFVTALRETMALPA